MLGVYFTFCREMREIGPTEPTESLGVRTEVIPARISLFGGSDLRRGMRGTHRLPAEAHPKAFAAWGRGAVGCFT